MTLQNNVGAMPVGHKDPLAAHWDELSSLVCSWWGKLTEEDVARIAGHKERLVRLLQDKYGYAPDRATREVDQRLQEYQDNTPSLAQSAATSPNFGEPAENVARTVLDADVAPSIRDTGEASRNQDIFARQWRQLRGTLRSWWGKLTDKELDEIGGHKDKLIGALQEKYQYTREQAEQEVGQRLQAYSKNRGSTLQSTAQDVVQTITETASGLTAQAQELGATAATAVVDRVAAAGTYLQEQKVADMTADVTTFLRRYPVPSLLLGVSLGYMLARRLGR